MPPSLVRAILGRFLNSSTIVIMRRKLFKLTLIQAFSTIVACSALLQGYGSEVSTTSAASKPGFVTVSGTHFLRDGAVWVPHGINVVAFNAALAVRTGLFGTAYKNFNPTEVAAMKAWGADSLRFLVAQPALDPQSSLYDPTFLTQLVAGVKSARAIGLSVIICMQDEAGTGETNPAVLPNDGTGRAWQALAPKFANDNGVMFELMNEPELAPSPANWTAWADTMNNMMAIIRNAGAKNVLLADGLAYAEQLKNAPILADPLAQVAYASHPYAHSATDQTPAGWDAKFGNVSVNSVAPVLVTEWSLENAPNLKPNGFQYCDSNSPTAALNLLNYLQGKGIGLMVLSYDLPNQPQVPRDGRATINFNGTPSTLANNVGCTDATFGPGMIVQKWYRTGIVPSSLQ